MSEDKLQINVLYIELNDPNRKKCPHNWEDEQFNRKVGKDNE